LIIHESIYDKVKRCCCCIQAIKHRNPLDENNHVGPLIDTDAVEMYNSALTRVVEEGKILVEGGVLSGEGVQWMLRETCNCRQKFI
jgi:aldehyde dehydrogenase (NAD+)